MSYMRYRKIIRDRKSSNNLISIKDAKKKKCVVKCGTLRMLSEKRRSTRRVRPRESRGVNYIEGGSRRSWSTILMRQRKGATNGDRERGKEGGDAGLARENYRDKYAHCIVRALSVCASHINVSIGARVQRGGCEKERRRDTTYTQEVVERWI